MTSAVRWTALGDSFTAGTSVGERTWVDDLREALDRDHPGAECVNLAVPGARVDEVTQGQLGPAIELQPNLVTLVCGANDVVLSIRPDIGAFAATFSAMLARLRHELPNATLITGTYPDITRFYPLHPRSRVRVARGMHDLNAAVRILSARHDVACLEMAGHADEGLRANFAADGFHPSAGGHLRAARAFAQALSEFAGIDLELPTQEEAA